MSGRGVTGACGCCSRGKAHTQLSMMPRSLQTQRGGGDKPPATAAAADGKVKPKMSNADFRSMLLKK